jgi:hypothetical protein
MKKATITLISGLLLILMMVTTACDPKSGTAVTDTQPPKHEHHPPHGGTPVVLGDEIYHLELVRDESTGKLQAFVFDGELENFIRSAASSFEVVATVGGVSKTLVFRAVANPATGETPGDSSLFEAQADWLKSTSQFDAVLKTLTVRGTTFTDVRFNFPKGNDDDA